MDLLHDMRLFKVSQLTHFVRRTPILGRLYQKPYTLKLKNKYLNSIINADNC